MRINAISVRLNYTSSWFNRSIPGRVYNTQTLKSIKNLKSLLQKLFEHSIIRNQILLGYLRYKHYNTNSYLINVYIYMYKYSDLYNNKKNKHPKKIILTSYIRKVFCQTILSRLIFWLRSYLLKNNLKINFVLVVNRFFTAELVSKYIINRLVNQFKITKIMSTIGRDLVFNKRNLGMLVHCSGRFDRKERASYHIFPYGKTSLSTLNKKIFFYKNEATLKYGVCGIKVWLLKK